MRIEFHDVRKRFGKVEALRGVELTVPSAARLALIGPNGSGKSTLIRALLGLIDCEGKVLLDGRSPFENRVALARRLSYVPQVAPQLSASVGEVVELVRYTRELDAAAIPSMAGRLGLSLDEVRRRPFRNLSGGMKQKVLLAIAFAARPSLLVLDEPTASLDARSREKFFALCAELPKETTVLLCSHRLEELRQLAEQVVSLEEGRVEFSGSAKDYLATLTRPAGPQLVESDGGLLASGAYHG